MEDTNLEKLRKLTMSLSTPLTEFVMQTHTTIANKGYVEYECGNTGTVFGIILYKDELLSVQRVFMSSGSILQRNKPDLDLEFIIVYNGGICVCSGDIKVDLLPGDSFRTIPATSYTYTSCISSSYLSIELHLPKE